MWLTLSVPRFPSSETWDNWPIAGSKLIFCSSGIVANLSLLKETYFGFPMIRFPVFSLLYEQVRILNVGMSGIVMVVYGSSAMGQTILVVGAIF